MPSSYVKYKEGGSHRKKAKEWLPRIEDPAEMVNNQLEGLNNFI